jgi:hypothetical protein
MSHPYWPQPSYIFRRQKAAPVPDAYGNYEFGASPGPKAGKGSGKTPTAYDIGPSGAQAKKRGFGAVSLRALQKTYGSLSPKTDWATPRYIRNEPSGLGAFDPAQIAQIMTGSADSAGGNCLSNVIGTVAGKVDGWVRSIPGIGSVLDSLPAKIGPILISPAEITAYALNKAVSGFSAYFTGGDAAAHKYEMVAGIMNVLPAFPEQVPGLETYRGQIAQRIVDELINATASCMAGGGSGGGGQAGGGSGGGGQGFQMMQISPEFQMAPGFMQAVAMAAHPEIWQLDTSKVSAQVSAPPKPAGGSSVMLIAGAAILAYLLIK